MSTPQTQVQVRPEDRVRSLLATESIKKRFSEMLGPRSNAFISSIISAVSANKKLAESEPMSVIASAAVAASMDLPINPSLGLAHIVPYQGVAQFQIGWKGLIQLALRTGQYKTINVTKVLEGQLKSHNTFTGEMVFQEEFTSEKVIGFLLYFRLLNGYEKYFYMTEKQCHDHGKKYSASFKKNFGPWCEDFEAMALKTVVKMGLSKYGILSVEMQRAMEVDQAQVDADGGVIQYPDSPPDAAQEAPKPAGATGPRGLRTIIDAQTTQQAPPQQPPAQKAQDVPLAGSGENVPI